MNTSWSVRSKELRKEVSTAAYAFSRSSGCWRNTSERPSSDVIKKKKRMREHEELQSVAEAMLQRKPSRRTCCRRSNRMWCLGVALARWLMVWCISLGQGQKVASAVLWWELPHQPQLEEEWPQLRQQRLQREVQEVASTWRNIEKWCGRQIHTIRTRNKDS